MQAAPASASRRGRPTPTGHRRVPPSAPLTCAAASSSAGA
eukprot:CAMPEP_0171219248 /NCGR_PEP_ID=MMETSP0790-20130122/33617_1 /TAXON_ID=2925 /ORGANISM="Alexandrium catenella, Strain OF101" /LENGTH=39 /DNA_ID= /DNA_START= /DNA_END= /DNA_ORIENTATION=